MALYYEFTSHLNTWLLLPALAGLVPYGLIAWHDYTPAGYRNPVGETPPHHPSMGSALTGGLMGLAVLGVVLVVFIVSGAVRDPSRDLGYRHAAGLEEEVSP